MHGECPGGIPPAGSDMSDIGCCDDDFWWTADKYSSIFTATHRIQDLDVMISLHQTGEDAGLVGISLIHYIGYRGCPALSF